LETRRKFSPTSVKIILKNKLILLLNILYKQKLEINQEIKLKIPTGTTKLSPEHVFKIHNTIEASEIQMNILFKLLSPETILKIFFYILEEKRIIITGLNIFQISSVIFALMKIIQPLKWEHILLPVLPVFYILKKIKFIDYVCAPMPIICGIHDSMMEKVLKQPTERIIFVDLDKNLILNNEDVNEDDFPYYKEILQQLLILQSESNN
jgi:hypothetical protein